MQIWAADTAARPCGRKPGPPARPLREGYVVYGGLHSQSREYIIWHFVHPESTLQTVCFEEGKNMIGTAKWN